ALTDTATTLREFGLIELSYERWLGQPAIRETAGQHLRRLDELLTAARGSNAIPGLTILDHGRRVDQAVRRSQRPRRRLDRRRHHHFHAG
ncbi:MAG TPA: hypothetical protein PKW63_03415, partial [Vicinamibacterales bacterium]|nr:hypothetical protein [Vicinamibacterales bacterium]